jgi:hypothetical protein
VSRAQVVYQTRGAGGGSLWVRKPHGGWRTIRFESGPTAAAKLLGLARALGQLGAAVTVPPSGGCLAVPRAVPDSARRIAPHARPDIEPSSPRAP